jgi:hypothetical protein
LQHLIPTLGQQIGVCIRAGSGLLPLLRNGIGAGVSLFATGTDGLVRSTCYDPRVANPQWAPWFSLPADQPFGPGDLFIVNKSVQRLRELCSAP